MLPVRNTEQFLQGIAQCEAIRREQSAQFAASKFLMQVVKTMWNDSPLRDGVM